MISKSKPRGVVPEIWAVAPAHHLRPKPEWCRCDVILLLGDFLSKHTAFSVSPES